MDSTGQIICKCLPGYTGKICENPQAQSCLNNPCQNAATCIPQTGLFFVNTLLQWIYKNNKVVSIFLNLGSYFCQCKANFYGQNCEFQVTTAICNAGDSNSNFCTVWSNFGFCSFTYTYNLIPVPLYCPQSCGLCKSVSSCSDSQKNCEYWASINRCDYINSLDPNLCKRSCGLCGGLIKKKKK